MSKNKDWLASAGTDTKLCHAGYDPSDYHGFVNPPVVHASTVLFPNARSMETRTQRYTYGTRGTPTTDALCAAIDELEGSAGTILVPSGLAAISIPFLAFLSAGDHALIVDSVYSPCRHFCDTMLARLGVEVEYYDPEIGSGIESLIRPNTPSFIPRLRIQYVRNAGYSHHCGGCAPAQLRGDDGQHLGDTALFQAARFRRRCVHSCRDQISSGIRTS